MSAVPLLLVTMTDVSGNNVLKTGIREVDQYGSINV